MATARVMSAPANATQPPNQTSAMTMGISTSAESTRWLSVASQARGDTFTSPLGSATALRPAFAPRLAT
ncbi:MAG TPA: hypothetical protein VKC57_04265 [Ktedonobacterales bacterium]|nr:hypothetical protein [Ktedonobacterales bacterium]